jgi:hypothetical protein
MRTLIVGTAVGVFITPCAFGADWATTSPTRHNVQENYVAAQSDAWNLFSGTPPSHVIPKRGKATIAVGVQYWDAAAVEESGNVADVTEMEPKLSVGGYQVSPLVVLQEARFGIGFGATLGKRTSEFRLSQHSIESGSAEFSGLRLSTYFVPKISFLPNYVWTSFLVGGEKIYVTHETKQSYPLNIPAVTIDDKARYSVTNLNLGLDVGILLSNRFIVLPWFDYGRRLSLSANSSTDEAKFQTNNILAADQSLFWRSEIRYGLDMQVRLSKLTLSFGGVLGFLAGLAKGSESVQDGGISAGLSIDL